jgi:hypothetical protein
MNTGVGPFSSSDFYQVEAMGLSDCRLEFYKHDAATMTNTKCHCSCAIENKQLRACFSLPYEVETCGVDAWQVDRPG